MCELGDISYYDQDGDERRVYEVNDRGEPSYLLRVLHRHEPRNLEQRIHQFIDDHWDFRRYGCRCGFTCDVWEHVIDHVQMFECRSCGHLFKKWEGWSYLCTACDQEENPEYHDRNPGWRYPG